MIAVDNLDALSQTQLRQTVELLMTELRHKSALVDKLTHEMAVLKRLKYAACWRRLKIDPLTRIVPTEI